LCVADTMLDAPDAFYLVPALRPLPAEPPRDRSISGWDIAAKEPPRLATAIRHPPPSAGLLFSRPQFRWGDRLGPAEVGQQRCQQTDCRQESTQLIDGGYAGGIGYPAEHRRADAGHAE